MNLVFVGLAPSTPLRDALLSSGFGVETAKEIPKASPDLLAVAVGKASDLADISRARKLHPHTWIAAVVKKTVLEKPGMLTALMQNEDKNDVWIFELWQQTFWFSVQQMRQYRALYGASEKLREDFNHLNDSSTRLIQQLEKDVSLATSIQRSILPKSSPRIPGISFSVKYIPAAGAGGDYYDIFELGDRKRFGVLVADSKSHGMAATLLAVLIKTRLEEMKDRFPDSASFITYLNREIRELAEGDLQSLSLLYGILDRGTLRFRFTAAGPLAPILWRNGPQVVATIANPAVGTVDHWDFKENILDLKPGDSLLLHTDGIEEPLATPQSTGREKLIELLQARAKQPDAMELQNEVMAILDRFVENQPLRDDLTLLHFSIDQKAFFLVDSQSSK